MRAVAALADKRRKVKLGSSLDLKTAGRMEQKGFEPEFGL
jgi:hypothetical protein